MELWGSSYLVQDCSPIKLVAMMGSSTPRESSGSVRISFMQEPGVLTVAEDASEVVLVVIWDVAVKLIALLQVLVLQNRLLRAETPLHTTIPLGRVFKVTGGAPSGNIVCSWAVGASEVKCRTVSDSVDQFELIIQEEAASQLAFAIAETLASTGLKNSDEVVDAHRE